MNERSSLAFLAHLLVKQPPGQQLTLHPHKALLVSFLSQAPPSVGSPYPLPTARPPAPSARVGRRQPCHVASARNALPKPTGHHQGNPGAGRGGGLPIPVVGIFSSTLSHACSGVEGHLLPVTRLDFGECLLPAFCTGPSSCLQQPF